MGGGGGAFSKIETEMLSDNKFSQILQRYCGISVERKITR
jgi:hypothetical protein